METYNIASALAEMAGRQPDALALAIPVRNSLDQNGRTRYQQYTFRELAQETNCLGSGLLAAGFKRGDRVVMMVSPGFEFCALSFALLQTGIVPVYIDPGIGIRNLKTCIAETEPAGFIGISKAHIARLAFGWGKNTIQQTVTIGPRIGWGVKTLHGLRDLGRSNPHAPFFEAGEDDIAAILYTSGSTGLSKGVVCTHGNFHAQLNMIRDMFQFSPGEIDLPTFPPYALFNAALGISSVIPDMDPTKPGWVNPLNIIQPINQFGITNMFGSPALLDTVGRYGAANGIRIPRLKKVISSGAPASLKALRMFTSMLEPDAEILIPYGATESMPVSIIGSRQLLGEHLEKTEQGHGICVGKPVRDVEVAIIRISEDELPQWAVELKSEPGKTGEIVVRGSNVTKSYYNREVATRLAKIQDGKGFYHRTGDLGYFDEAGNLWYCGRKSHRVQLEGKELYSIPCEYIFNQHPAVLRTALVAVQGKAVLCVEPEKSVGLRNHTEIKKELLEMAKANPATEAIETILFHRRFPVDIRHNAKIIREKLTEWATKKLT